MDSRPELRLAHGDRRRNAKFGRPEFLFGEIASNRRQNFLPSPLVMVKRGMVKKNHGYDRRQKSFEPAARPVEAQNLIVKNRETHVPRLINR